MDVLRITYEIRYSKMLNFKSIYKEIINPYFMYPNTKYAIGSEGNHQESIRVTFEDSKHYILFAFDRISFQFDCTAEELDGKTNHVDMCFEIFNKIKEQKTFTKVNLEILEIVFFENSELSNSEITNKFIEYFNLNLTKAKLDDASVILDRKQSNLMYNLQFGPYNAVKDNKNLNLFSLDFKRKLEYEDKNGLILKCAINKETDIISNKTYSFLLKKAKEFTQEVFENYG